MVLVAKVSVHVPTHHHIDSGTTAGFYYLRQFLYCLHLYITRKIGQNKELILQAGITPKRLIQLDKRTLSGTVDGRHTLDNGSVCIRNNSIEYISIAIEQYPFFTLSHHIFVQTSKAIESIAGNSSIIQYYFTEIGRNGNGYSPSQFFQHVIDLSASILTIV